MYKHLLYLLFFSFYFSLFSQEKIINYAIPSCLNSDVILQHEGFTISYNPKYKQANWVAYRLIGEDMNVTIKRTNKFTADPSYPACATHSDYSKSGYDRGHLFPAGSAWTTSIMEQSFYYTNMSPQIPEFNRGVWKKIEETVRKWALAYDTVYVVTGCVLHAGLPYIGNSVSVPEYFYKLVLVYKQDRKQAIVFYIRNEKSETTSFHSYLIPVNGLEEKLGMDFCIALPDAIEEEIEQSFNYKDWLFE